MRRILAVASSAQQYPNVPLPNQVTSRATFLPFTDGANTWQGRFTPIEMANGNWMGVWVEGTNHSDYNGATQKFNIAFSNDEGATWTANNTKIGGGAVTGFPLVPPTASTGFVDCALIKCPNGDLVIIAQNRGSNPTVWNAVNFSQHQYRSTDNGETWVYEYDFCDHIGENTTALRAKIQGLYETMVVGSTVYLILCQIRTNLDDTRLRLYKSTDNCATWSFVSNPVEYDEADPDCTESSIADLGNGIFFCVFRTQDLSTAVWKRSDDFGLTWGALTDFGPIAGYVGVHQPRVLRLANFFLLMGRDYKYVPGDPNSALHSRSAFWTTTDLFATPCRRQYLDPFYAGAGLVPPNNGDSGYTKGLFKADGSFVFFGYWGTATTARIYKYDASHTSSPSTEHYSNTNFFPDTITPNGVRLQLNRDNITASPSAPSFGIAIISRAHNTLATDAVVWTPQATANIELEIIDDIGWATTSDGHFLSVGTLPNLIFKNSFSVGWWLMPDDGQPAVTNVLLWNNSNTTSTLADGVMVQITTTGLVLARYAENSVLRTLLTSSSMFANGAITTPRHLGITFTSGDKIRVYFDGVLQSDDGVNTGSLVGITMANYNSSNGVLMGRRQTGASTYDLPYVGKVREFIMQPVVWTQPQIASIMTN